MSTLAWLVTLVDVDTCGADPHQLSLIARDEAVLDDGRRLPLQDDRGWNGASGERAEHEVHRVSFSPRGHTDASAARAVKAVREVLRIVDPARPPVGPPRGHLGADRADYLMRVLEQHGVVVDPDDLRRLPHGIVLGQRLLTLLGRDQAGQVSA